MLDIGPIHRKEYATGVDRAKVFIGEAPGRVHLLGEHGEPGAGLYLSVAIDRRARVAVSARKDSSIRFFAADLNERKRTTLSNLKFKREDRWANYIKVAIHVFVELGFPVKGLNFTLVGDIPQQVGLASSSAIEVAALTALRSFFKATISEQDLLEKLCDAHEEFFGTPADLVDYLIAFEARKDHFIYVDEASGEARKIKAPFTRCKILIVDSRVPRLGTETELSKRGEDVKKGLEMLSQLHGGNSFKEYASADFVDFMGDFPEQVRRRSMYVVQEINRVNEAVDALQRLELDAFSKIIYHSHESLRDMYEVSCPEIDWLVKRGQETDGVLGSRMTGRGFGGCTYAVVRNGACAEYKRRLEDYERIFGFKPTIHEVQIATGRRTVTA